MDVSLRKQAAERAFGRGYNCSQAVVLAFEDLLPADRAFLLRAASSFGGGMGRLREVCGAVSGMFLVVGALLGYDTPDAGYEKKAQYARVQLLARRFKEANGSIVCRQLLGLPIQWDSPDPTERTPEFYRKRPCKELVGMAAALLAEYLNEVGYKAPDTSNAAD